MIQSSEESDSLATSGAGLRCCATQKSQKAHAEQQQRVRRFHPRPRARHALAPKYRNASEKPPASTDVSTRLRARTLHPPPQQHSHPRHSPSLGRGGGGSLCPEQGVEGQNTLRCGWGWGLARLNNGKGAETLRGRGRQGTFPSCGQPVVRILDVEPQVFRVSAPRL